MASIIDIDSREIDYSITARMENREDAKSKF
jgi:hypothetical protein